MQTASTSNLTIEIKKLAHLAWPLLIAQITQTLMGVVDTIMSGRYGAVDMAAVAIGSGIALPILIFIQGLCLALSPQIARIHGRNRVFPVADWVYQALYLTLSVSAIVLLSIPFLPQLFDLLDMSDALQSKSLDYVRYVFCCVPAFAVYQVLRNYCEGLSRTRPTMVIMFTGLIVNIPANYIFINGALGMPEMGGAGSGLATMIVFYTMAFATFIYTYREKNLQKYRLYKGVRKFKWLKVKTIAAMGLPIAFTLLAEVSLFALVAILLAPLGENAVASHQVALSFSSLIFMLPLSIGMAVAIRIGYLIGENRIHVTPMAYKSALIFALSTVVFTASITVIGANAIANLYSNDEIVITLASGLLLYAAIFQFSDAVQVVSANALRGYKDNKAMLIISITSYWGVGLPTGIIFGLTDYVVEPMAAKGFWIGFIVGLSTAAILMTARLKIIQRHLLS